MEIKARLIKPYTEKERLDFIVEQNHINGYEVQETEEALEALGLTQEEIEQREKERVMELKMTPLDFLKALELLGISYEQVKAIMEANPLVEREMRYCSNVYRKHPMIEQFAQQYGITSEQLDYIFKKANGEEE